MAFVFACEFPDDLWFHVEQDVWLDLLPDGTARVGMTDPAVTRAGKILHVRIRAGREVEAGRSVASVESGKWVGPVPSPLPGHVLEANPAVLDDPSLINRDPYGAGWLATMRPAVGPEEFGRLGLLRGADALAPYTEKLRTEGLHCIRCADLPSQA